MSKYVIFKETNVIKLSLFYKILLTQAMKKYSNSASNFTSEGVAMI